MYTLENNTAISLLRNIGNNNVKSHKYTRREFLNAGPGGKSSPFKFTDWLLIFASFCLVASQMNCLSSAFSFNWLANVHLSISSLYIAIQFCNNSEQVIHKLYTCALVIQAFHPFRSVNWYRQFVSGNSALCSTVVVK